jgi:hypothetical protein
MIRFFSILLLNAWRGMRRANATPALVLTLIGVCVLFIGSNAAANASSHDTTHTAGRNSTSNRQPQTFAFGAIAATNSGLPMIAKGKNNAPAQPKADNKVASTTDPTHSSQTTANSSKTTDQSSQGTSTATATVSLQPNPLSTSCKQGTTTYTVQSAQLTLSTPTTAKGTVTWFWEMRLDSGSNTSGASPISSNTSSQSVPADVTSVVLPASAQSQPLLTTSSNANYAYSFRLHVIFDSNDTTSAWMSVPQAATNDTCGQNQ